MSFFRNPVLVSHIDILDKDAKEDAYLLSMPFFASAQLQDQKRYDQIQPKFKTALNKLPENSFKAWMLGRMVLGINFIIDSVKDKEELDELLLTLIQEQLGMLTKLKELLKVCEKDAFSAWAKGYLAALNSDEYNSAKAEMQTDESALASLYQSKVKSKSEEKEIHKALSAILWTYVMNLQAAAVNHDLANYERILAEIRKVTESDSVAIGLTKCLVREEKSNDYLAWALGIVHYSAVVIGDSNDKHCREIEAALLHSIQAAKDAKAMAEETLALINLELANEVRASKKIELSAKNRSVISVP